jgi:hypothetical protein
VEKARFGQILEKERETGVAGVKIEPVCRPAEGEVLNTFVMYYPDAEAQRSSSVPDIIVRGSTARYSDFVSKNRPFTITLGPVLYRIGFCSMSEALLALAAYGISVDFVETFHMERWNEKLTGFIDMRRANPEKAELVANFPRHYVVQTRHSLPFAVVDRFAQASNIDFSKGKFESKAVRCRFRDRSDATDWCWKANEKSILARDRGL